MTISHSIKETTPISMTISVQSCPWVTLRPGDVGYQLSNDCVVSNRASIEITGACPGEYAYIIAQALEHGWIRAVAVVPKTDPTLMWDLLRAK